MGVRGWFSNVVCGPACDRLTCEDLAHTLVPPPTGEAIANIALHGVWQVCTRAFQMLRGIPPGTTQTMCEKIKDGVSGCPTVAGSMC